MNRREINRTVFMLAALAVAAASARPALAGGKHHKKRLLVTFLEGTGRAERAQAAKDMGLSVSDDLDSLEVSVLESAGDVAPQEVSKARKHPRVYQVEEDVYRNWLFESPASFQSTPLPSVESVISALGRPRKPAPQPADPASGGGRTSPASAGDAPWGVARVNAPAAWSSGQGSGVKVAVIDTGIDCTHPDLQCDFSQGANIVDPSATPMDDNEHGTHVSGTIAGRGKGGPVGVAPKATLLAVKVLDAQGSGNLSDIVKGINWATKHGADVINMSLGGASGSAALERAVKQALAAGVVVVAAAGNSGGSVGFPGAYDDTIAVAASDSNDKLASLSSRGPEVDFIAPGVDVLSAKMGGGFISYSGTSMASPHVAGLAALAVSQGYVGLNGPDGVFAQLKKAASPLAGGLTAEMQGAGMIDAGKLAR